MPSDALPFTLLAGLIFAGAVLYSSGGHAGASAYIAAMGLFAVVPGVMKPTAARFPPPSSEVPCNFPSPPLSHCSGPLNSAIDELLDDLNERVSSGSCGGTSVGSGAVSRPFSGTNS